MPSLDININPNGARAGASVVIHELRRVSRQAKDTTSQVDQRFKNLNQSIGAVRSVVAGLGITLGAAFAVRTLVDTIRTVGQFQQAMSGVLAVTQANQAQFQALTDTAKELGKTTRFTATEAANGMEFLGRAGFNTDQIIKAIPATLDLASAGMLGLAEAADIVSNIMQGFGIQAEFTTHTADVLAQTAASSNTNIRQLGEAMSFVAPASRSLGVSIEHTSAIIGLMGNAGIQGTRAGTALRNIMAQLSAPTKKARDTLAELHLSVKDVNIESRGLIPVLKTLKDAGVDFEDAVNLINKRGATPLIAVLDQLGTQFDILRGKIDDSAGVSIKMAQTMENNIPGAFRRLRSAVEGSLIDLGDTGLAGAVRDIIDVFTDLIRNSPYVIATVGVELAGAFRSLAVVIVGTIDGLKILGNTLALFGAATLFLPLNGLAGLKDRFDDLTKSMADSDAHMRRLLGLQGQLSSEANDAARNEKRIADARAQADKSKAMQEEERKQREAAAAAKGSTTAGDGGEISQFRQVLRDQQEQLRITRAQIDAEQQVGQARTQALRAIEVEKRTLDLVNRAVGDNKDVTNSQRAALHAVAAASVDAEQALADVQERQKQLERVTQATTDALTAQATQLNMADATLKIYNATVGDDAARKTQLELLRIEETLRSQGVTLLEDQRNGLEAIVHARVAASEATQAQIDRERLLKDIQTNRTDLLTNIARETNYLNALVHAQDLEAGERRVQIQLLDIENDLRRQTGQGLGTMREGVEQLIRTQERYRDLIDKSRGPLRRFAEDAQDIWRGLQDAGINALQGIEDALVEFVTTGKTSVKDLVNSIYQDLLRLSIRQSITGPLAKGLNSAIGSLFGGGGGGLLAGLFGGGGGAATSAAVGAIGGGFSFATGGTVPGPFGTPRLALVHGGEQISTPEQNRLQGDSTVHVTNQFFIQTPNPEAFRSTLDHIAAKTSQSMQRALQRRGITRTSL